MQKKGFFHQNSELVMVSLTLGILLILFIPISANLLDFLLIANLSWALTILLLAFFTDKPLSFSTFPALLLISTLFRLALNISATRLILTEASAGDVIASIGQYVIHDNYVMGLVVFLMLIIVQYLVITNGSQRIAEVAARFTLDSLPGKQMSIDADLNMGLISQEEAKFRRSQLEKEANFYGAMDGASKFVKGDAIAGILIILVDLIGGFAIGLVEKGLGLVESIHRYSLLTVGDGLITQIPALVISLATGIIVTRAASDSELGTEVARQISAYPKSLFLVAAALSALLSLKGMPFLPVFIMLSLFILGGIYALRAGKKQSPLKEVSLYEKIRILPIEIKIHPNLFVALEEKNLLSLIQNLREELAYSLGFVIPEVGISQDPNLAHSSYGLYIQDTHEGEATLYLDKILCIGHDLGALNLKGLKAEDPECGLSALWINPVDEKKALGFNLYTPLQALKLQLRTWLSRNLSSLLTRTETETLLNQEGLPRLRDELIPSLLTFGQVQRILQNLLQEQVSLRPLTSILETLLEHAKNVQDPSHLTELVRMKLASPICQNLLDKKASLPVVTLAPTLEQKLSQGLNTHGFILDPELTENFVLNLASQVQKMLVEKNKPVLLCSSLLRRQIRQLTQRLMPQLTVLGLNEIPINVQIEAIHVLK